MYLLIEVVGIAERVEIFGFQNGAIINRPFFIFLMLGFCAFDLNCQTWWERLKPMFHWITLDFRFLLVRVGVCKLITVDVLISEIKSNDFFLYFSRTEYLSY
jgi:hypothetical protein